MTGIFRPIAITLLCVNGLSAVAGGFGLIGDPSGRSLGWTTDLLASSPFENFLVPGIILFTGNGLLSLTIAIAAIKKMKAYPMLILFQGAFLFLWVIIQMMMLQFYHPLHLIFGVMAVVLILCGYTLSKTSVPASKS